MVGSKKRFVLPALAIAATMSLGTVSGALAAPKKKTVVKVKVVKGPRGPVGKTGPAGATGPAGVPGAAGATGPAGAAGIAGTAAAIVVSGGQKAVGGDVTTTGTAVGTLAGLAPGAYFVSARVTLTGADSPANGQADVTCSLAVGGVTHAATTTINDADGSKGAHAAVVELSGSATLTAAGSAVLTCTKVLFTTVPPGTIATVAASQVAISAIKVGSETHPALG